MRNPHKQIRLKSEVHAKALAVNTVLAPLPLWDVFELASFTGS